MYQKLAEYVFHRNVLPFSVNNEGLGEGKESSGLLRETEPLTRPSLIHMTYMDTLISMSSVVQGLLGENSDGLSVHCPRGHGFSHTCKLSSILGNSNISCALKNPDMTFSVSSSSLESQIQDYVIILWQRFQSRR